MSDRPAETMPTTRAPRVLVSDSLSPSALAVLERRGVQADGPGVGAGFGPPLEHDDVHVPTGQERTEEQPGGPAPDDEDVARPDGRARSR